MEQNACPHFLLPITTYSPSHVSYRRLLVSAARAALGRLDSFQVGKDDKLFNTTWQTMILNPYRASGYLVRTSSKCYLLF